MNIKEMEKDILKKHEVTNRNELAKKTFDHIKEIGGIIVAADYSTMHRNYYGYKAFNQNEFFINKVISYGTVPSFLDFCDKVLTNEVDKNGVLKWKCNFLIII